MNHRSEIFHIRDRGIPREQTGRVPIVADAPVDDVEDRHAARLERDLSEQDKRVAQEKERLDYSIQQIVNTLTLVANGNYDARIPTNDTTLWAIVGPVNNLLNRNQRLRLMEMEYARTQEVLSYLLTSIQQARHSGQPVYLPTVRTGTQLDALLAELQNTTVTFRTR